MLENHICPRSRKCLQIAHNSLGKNEVVHRKNHFVQKKTTSELRTNQKNEIFISYLLVPDEYLNVLWSKGLIMCKNQETGIC